jgi:uncharacterized protein (TIGR02453 family)
VEICYFFILEVVITVSKTSPIFGRENEKFQSNNLTFLTIISLKMPIITQTYFDFFKDLAQNNSSEWFHANKKRYEKDAKEPFMTLVEAIVASLSDTEPDLALTPVKSMIFRINRDIRFSKDKRPYKENLAASIGRGGTKDKVSPGHYFHLGIAENFLAGGCYWFEEKETLYRVRNFIAQNPERFSQLIENKDFKAKWGVIKGEKNKRIPPEFADDVALQPLIMNTQFYWGASLSNDVVLSDNFVDILRGFWLAAQPMNAFFREAMYG